MPFFKKNKITYTHKCLFEFPFYKDGERLYPIIEIDFYNIPANKKIERIVCLLDSGADFTVLPTDLGELLGFDFNDLDPVDPPDAVSGKAEGCKWYKTPLTIKFLGTSFLTEVMWCGSKDTHPLIGRKGFFDNFDVIFRQKNDRITLVFHPTPNCHHLKQKEENN